MEQDPYEIFTRAHRVYIKGVRAGIAECLRTAYGSDWWEHGVLSAIGDNQRENLERDLEKGAPEDITQLPDTAHFARIVQRNHAAAFVSLFPNMDHVMRLLSHLSAMRNQWAHVADDQWTVPNVMQSVQAMREILIALRRREALEMNQMFQNSLDHQASISEEVLNLLEEAAPAIENDSPLPSDYALLAFWRTLESYLIVESTVPPATDEEQDPALVRVVVRVTNTAPAGEGRPDITFSNVRLEITGAQAFRQRGRHYDPYQEWRNLEPGQTQTVEFMAPEKGLASIELRVTGHVDQNRLLQVQHRSNLPEEVVAPLLTQFSVEFEGVGIEESLATIVKTANQIQPDMPFAEVSAVRNELGQFKLLITQKREVLGALFEEYHLDRESLLGTAFREVILLLGELEQRKIDEMDTAISHTDMESIRNVACDFEQLQIAVLRARDTIRQRMSLPSQ